MKYAKLIPVLALLLIISLASCTKNNPAPANNTSLIGDWHKDLSGITVHIKLKNATDYSVGYDAGSGFVETVSGPYTSTSTSFTILTSNDPNSCPTTHGEYGYTISGNTLTTTLINDPCVDNRGQPRSSVSVGVFTR
jgi:hypothetical protein